LIDTAVDCAADAVKFQTFSAEQVVSKCAPKAEYQRENTSNFESQLEMLKRLELSQDDHRKLYEYCKKKGVVFLSTPFDKESADFLEELGVEAFKISSGEITNIPLLVYIARKHKPMILSTGMSTLEEVRRAIKVIRKSGNQDIVLLHCVSSYPSRPEDINLRAMQTMARVFKVPVGYSDHTLGIDIAIAAVALGAKVIEKHFTLDCNLAGPDHKSSLEPDDLKELVASIRRVELALGNGCKKPATCEAEIAVVARKSLVAACEIKAGTILNEELIAVKRPGTGLSPSMMPVVIGRKTKVDIAKDDLLSLDMLI
jgi:N-acetylneuraminate synthase